MVIPSISRLPAVELIDTWFASDVVAPMKSAREDDGVVVRVKIHLDGVAQLALHIAEGS